MINNNYVPEWYTTSFEHMRYTLVRNQDQLDILFDKAKAPFEFLESNADARVSFIDDYAIVQIKDESTWDLNQIHGLLLHEAVHIWQELKIKMGEESPSAEFEAYSVQSIAHNLFDMYEESEHENSSVHNQRSLGHR